MVLARKTASERIGKQVAASCSLELPMARSDLADYFGLTTESDSPTLSQMKKQEAIP